jgi:hypothetical protein
MTIRGAAAGRQTIDGVSGVAVNSPPRYHDNGSGGKLLRPENQVVYAAAPTAAQTRDALISAGIMKPA